MPTATSVDAAEIERFAKLADAWWDPQGAFRPLHKLNPVRLAFIRDQLSFHYRREPTAKRPLAGLRLLDIGCGGGLVSEPMARLGAEVVGIDAGEKNVVVARLHAEQAGLAIDYRSGTAEALWQAGERFDAVLNLEVVEHVADVELFIQASAGLLKPGGAMVVATLNRTAKAFAFAILGAEYVLGWVPRGTHSWTKFVRPSELDAALRLSGMRLQQLSGVSYSPLADSWRLSKDLDVNYLGFAVKD
ncbi:MAG: bifunctional 2-polyprenyl-6-hydroxyphenol methylase/3-demethylubiquinol 3-O-methyltransferase UbiG [Proteobacteria bacterium]|nr:bifunctional 2-polyprenyl-6-hydroxyphenol methylase/3-demethylubiquinol 3-O-methyltransferase UbiG [Pseudomonadota bacterium]MBI3496495.1 bifunctional 2-polyprenyl-6-hydroxyphenol methylase/3-demethylubiquinol 3-O-methyltransferase UbiG [Pseudomonadota bacterium]